MVNFKHFVYGGIDSADYGVYISGEGVFNAPERAVELVTVAGRNGAVAIDQGHWENIEVVYPAGMFAADQTEFRTRLADFRNALKSQIGYQRLQDDYHPNEYREALIIDAVEVSPAHMATAGEFDIIFNCKPQRFLTSGENEITVTSGATLTNPTQYDSSPMIKTEGYGTLTVGGKEIELINDVFGRVELAQAQTFNSVSNVINLADTPMTLGDPIKMAWVQVKLNLKATDTVTDLAMSMPTTSGPAGGARVNKAMLDTDMFRAKLWLDGIEFSKSTISGLTAKATTTVSCKVGGTSVSFTMTAQAKYYGADNMIEVSAGATGLPASLMVVFIEVMTDQVFGDSTATILGHPTYIDCDLGECYKLDNGNVISLNRYVDLGSDLPTLSGNTTVTYDNTFTSVKVVPRWWQL